MAYLRGVTFNNRCLDANMGQISQNGAVVELWDCNGELNQLWIPSYDGQIHSAYNNRCLDMDLTASDGDNGSYIKLYDCWGGSNQQWHLDGDGVHIHNAYNNRCLDAAMGGIANNGDKVQVWDCGGVGNQAWSGSGGPALGQMLPP